jgi:hypothetical protein
MRPNSVIEYRSAAGPRKTRPMSAYVFVCLTVLLATLWVIALFPYDPPRDWSSLLGAPEEAVVRFLIWIATIAWIIAGVACARTIRHRRRAA